MRHTAMRTVHSLAGKSLESTAEVRENKGGGSFIILNDQIAACEASEMPVGALLGTGILKPPTPLPPSLHPCSVVAGPRVDVLELRLGPPDGAPGSPAPPAAVAPAVRSVLAPAGLPAGHVGRVRGPRGHLRHRWDHQHHLAASPGRAVPTSLPRLRPHPAGDHGVRRPPLHLRPPEVPLLAGVRGPPRRALPAHVPPDAPRAGGGFSAATGYL